LVLLLLTIVCRQLILAVAVPRRNNWKNHFNSMTSSAAALFSLLLHGFSFQLAFLLLLAKRDEDDDDFVNANDDDSSSSCQQTVWRLTDCF
jgi:hypothetical protein